MGGETTRVSDGVAGGEQVVWGVAGTGKRPTKENPWMGQGTRTGKGGGAGTDGEFKTRECTQELENRRGWRWGALHVSWNGAAHTECHNTCKREDFQRRTKDGEELKDLGAEHAIRITSLNIRSKRAGGLEAVIWALKYGNVVVAILQEKNITKGIHMRYGSEYYV